MMNSTMLKITLYAIFLVGYVISQSVEGSTDNDDNEDSFVDYNFDAFDDTEYSLDSESK